MIKKDLKEIISFLTVTDEQYNFYEKYLLDSFGNIKLFSFMTDRQKEFMELGIWSGLSFKGMPVIRERQLIHLPKGFHEIDLTELGNDLSKWRMEIYKKGSIR